jgi:hypothetical protein
MTGTGRLRQAASPGRRERAIDALKKTPPGSVQCAAATNMPARRRV